MKKIKQVRIAAIGLVLPGLAQAAEFHGFVGAGMAVSPLYSGASHYAPGPVLKGGFAVETEAWGRVGVSTDGVMWQPMPDGQLVFGLLATRDEGRKETFDYPFSGKQNRDLNGMGDLPDTLMAGAQLRYQKTDLALWIRVLSATQKRDYGGEALGPMTTIAAGAQTALWRWHGAALSVGSDLNWASRGYLQAHYGVTGRQAERTGFDDYAPSSGWQKGGIYTGLSWELTSSLSAGVSGRVDYLFSEAGRSPLVNSRAQYTLSSLIQYSF